MPAYNDQQLRLQYPLIKQQCEKEFFYFLMPTERILFKINKQQKINRLKPQFSEN